MIFDTHAHYDDEAFNTDREELLGKFLPENGIGKVVNVGANAAGTLASVNLAGRYDYIYASVGIHPSEVMEYETGHAEGIKDVIDIAWLKKQAENPKTVAVGEIGLDYHELEFADENVQKKWFVKQLEAAMELNLPVIVHSRDAAQDTYDILKETGGDKIKAVIHCFSYEKEMAERFLKLGYYIGIGGVLTYKNARKQVETLETMPLDRLLLETDCPYLSPVPHRGERNSSLNLPLVISRMAEIRGMSEKEIEEITYENACRFYGIK